MVQSCAIFGLGPCGPIERDGESVLHNWSRVSGPLLSKRNPVSTNPNHSAPKPRVGWGPCGDLLTVKTTSLKQNTQVGKAKNASFLNARISPLENCEF